MNLPHWPDPRPLPRLTPSLYNAAKACPARALWMEYGDKAVFPTGPQSLLGSAYHAVLEDAARGVLPAGQAQRHRAAEASFDKAASIIWARAHPLLRWRYNSIENIPFYYTRRAEAAEAADQESANPISGNRTEARAPSRLIEWAAASRDGLIQGRIDYVDIAKGIVADYKSGNDPPEGQPYLETEVRQLRLYAYLCAENDIPIETGVIIRRGGRRDTFPITSEETEVEAKEARDFWAIISKHVSSANDASELATPSPASCRYCPCRPICDPFWKAVTDEWSAEVGYCTEAYVESISRHEAWDGAALTMKLNIVRGSIPLGPSTATRFPVALVEVDGSPPLKVRDEIRIVDAAYDEDVNILQPKRNAITTVWLKG